MKKAKGQSRREKWLYTVPVLLGIATFLAFLLIRAQLLPRESVIVNTLNGQLRGYTDYSRGGRKFYGFRGIPYASPPVGELRFEVTVKIICI